MINIQNSIIDRIAKGVAAAGFEQVLNMIIQLVSVPLYLHYWGIALYGEWILLFTFPSYLAMSDLGFAKAAVNSITLNYAEGNYENANRFYHTCFVLLAFLGIMTIVIVLLALHFLPTLSRSLNIEILASWEVNLVIVLLTIYILLFQQAELLRGIVAASGKFYYSMGLVGIYRFLEFCFIIILVIAGFGPIHIATVYLLFQLVMIIQLVIYIKLSFTWSQIGLSATRFYASKSALKSMIRPAFAFAILPVSYALRIHFPVVVIGVLFSPATIVIYTTTRTLINAGNQIIGAFSKAISPEYALAFGSGNLQRIRSIHHNSCNVALGLSIIFFMFMLIFGELFIRLWTQNAIPFNYTLFLSLLISMVLYSIWSTSSYLAYSINQHTKQSVFFLLSSVIGSVVTYVLLYFYDVSLAVIGTVVADMTMVIYVLIINTKILNESLAELSRNVFRFPSFASIRNI